MLPSLCLRGHLHRPRARWEPGYYEPTPIVPLPVFPAFGTLLPHGLVVLGTLSSPNRTASSVVVGAATSSLIVMGSCLPSLSSCRLHEGQVVSVW
jgi:hypothetical protein